MTYDFKMIEGLGVYKWTIDFERSLDNSVLFTNVTGGEWKNIRNPRTESVLHIPRQVDKRRFDRNFAPVGRYSRHRSEG